MTNTDWIEKTPGYWRGRASTREKFAFEDEQRGIDPKPYLLIAAEYDAKAKELARWTA